MYVSENIWSSKGRNPASKSLQSTEISLYLAFTNELNVAQKENPGPTQGDTTRTLQSSISICHLNIRSLRNKIDDIVHMDKDSFIRESQYCNPQD
jgi:hypothetical protein